MPSGRAGFGVGLGGSRERLSPWEMSPRVAFSDVPAIRDISCRVGRGSRRRTILKAQAQIQIYFFFKSAENRLGEVPSVDAAVRRRALRLLSEPLVYGPIPVEARFLQALMAAQAGSQGTGAAIGGKHSSCFPVLGTADDGWYCGSAGAERRRRTGASHHGKSFHLLSLDTAVSRFRQALLSLALGDGESAISFLRSGPRRSRA